MENGCAPAEFEYRKEFAQVFVQDRNNLASLVSVDAPSPGLEDGVLKEWPFDLPGVLLGEADFQQGSPIGQHRPHTSCLGCHINYDDAY